MNSQHFQGALSLRMRIWVEHYNIRYTRLKLACPLQFPEPPRVPFHSFPGTFGIGICNPLSKGIHHSFHSLHILPWAPLTPALEMEGLQTTSHSPALPFLKFRCFHSDFLMLSLHLDFQCHLDLWMVHVIQLLFLLTDPLASYTKTAIKAARCFRTKS